MGQLERIFKYLNYIKEFSLAPFWLTNWLYYRFD